MVRDSAAILCYSALESRLFPILSIGLFTDEGDQ